MTSSEHSDGSKQPETVVELTTTTAGHALHTDDGHDFTNKQGDINQAAQDETSMGLLTALRNYPRAAAWSILLSTSIVMVAYDTILLNSFYAYPSFQKKKSPGLVMPKGNAGFQLSGRADFRMAQMLVGSLACCLLAACAMPTGQYQMRIDDFTLTLATGISL